MPTNYKIALAALAGFLLGAWLFRTPIATAQYTKYVHVQQARLGQDTRTTDPDVVGISCVRVQGQAECYIATVRRP
jgi:hypothetical protein